MNTPEMRAARLEAMLKLTAGHPILSVDEVMRYAPRHLTGVDVVHLEGVTDEDLALLNACVEVEYELREQGFAQAQRLLAFAAEGEGELDERLVKLPLPEFAAAAECLYALGWVTPKE